MDDEENVNEIQLPSSTKELNKPSQIAVIENNLFVSECENSTDRKRRWDVNEPEWSSSSGPSTLHVPVQIKKDKFSWIPSKPGKSATLPPTANMAEVLRCQKRQHTTDVRNSQLTASCVLILVVDIMIHQWVGDHYQILMGITFCAFIQILYIIDHHRQALLKQQLKDPLTKSLTIYNRYLLVELIANSLHCPPFLVTAWREARLLNICVIFKTASVMRLVRDHFFIDCLGGLLAGNLSRENVTMLFLAKTLLYRYPQRTILVLTIVVFLLNTVVLMSVENSSFWDIIWLQFVTMTTVGFGDVIPTRILGITVACVGSVQGILISSVSVALLTKGLNLKTSDKVMINFLNSFVLELRKRTIARDVVGKCCRIVTIIKRLEDMKRRTEKEILGRSKTQKRCQALESQLNQHRIELDGLLRKKKVCCFVVWNGSLFLFHPFKNFIIKKKTEV